MERILLGHGSGGRLTHNLIQDLFVKHFDNQVLKQLTDSAILKINTGNIAFTTDSYVVDPIFFPGGNIGKLAVCGTVNDLAVSGAIPKYLSASFIIEEGFSFNELQSIVSSMAAEAANAGVLIVTGDTKVVNKGQCDKLFINTTGIGFIEDSQKFISLGKDIKTGDKIILNGAIASHGMAIMAARNFENFKTEIQSDCACLNHLIKELIDAKCNIKFMRDATRGGIATVLSELSENNRFGLEIEESSVLIYENVRGMCELLGFDPFYVANEGKVLMVVSDQHAEKVIEIMKQNELGIESAIIGEVVDSHLGKTILKTRIGGSRIINMLAGEQLPRIC